MTQTFALLGGLLPLLLGFVQEPGKQAATQVDFARDIQPILVKECIGCHGPRQQRSGLRLDRRGDAFRGGYSGPPIHPGNSDASPLIARLEGKTLGLRMPNTGLPLEDEQIQLIRDWIDQGAVWPEEGMSVEAAVLPVGEAAPQPTHWAFRRVTKPEPPWVRDRAWPRNPIDAFVLSRLEAEGIEPSPEADKAVLLRRVSLDLTGLPPSPRQVRRFLRDNRPDAYQRMVEGLLASPHFGEKWAMHWLDQSRYADSDGYEKDQVRPYAWRYRHWVIDAFNQDMPFDRFAVEQLAGDLLPGAGVEERTATGFHRNTLTNREGGVDIEQFRFEQVVDRTNTVATVWLGLTMGCAQCHDHKYDPITQKDYYSFFAFFNSADEADIDAPLDGELGPYWNTRAEFEARRRALLEENQVFELMPPWEAQMREAAESPGKWTDWDHAFDALQKYLDNGYGILLKEPSARSAKETKGLVDHFVKNYHRVISKPRAEELKYRELFKVLQQLDREFPGLTQAQTIAERAEPRVSHVHIRGQYNRTGMEVEPAIPAFLGSPDQPPVSNRLQLARWIASPENPLTARVAVNRVWQELFGTGLVKTSADFGARGEEPTHPELLDWLAGDFIERGWSVKSLLQRIVTSATYRQSSRARPEIDSKDPENRLLARQRRLRLPAELIRDGALQAAGLLDTRVGGPSVRPALPQGLTELSYANSVQWETSQGRDLYRRGLYVHFQRTVPHPFLMNFDTPDKSVTVCRRERSTTPLQALNLLNDPAFDEAARGLAARILTESKGEPVERIAYAFRLCLARDPSPSELARLGQYFEEERAGLDPEAASSRFPIPLPGVDPIEAGAWTNLASVLLNLNEFITRE